MRNSKQGGARPGAGRPKGTKNPTPKHLDDRPIKDRPVITVDLPLAQQNGRTMDSRLAGKVISGKTLVELYVTSGEWEAVMGTLVDMAVTWRSLEAIKLLLAYRDGYPLHRQEVTGISGNAIIEDVNVIINRIAVLTEQRRIEGSTDEADPG